MDQSEVELNLPTLSDNEPSLPVAPPFNHNQRKRPFLRSRGPSRYDTQLADAINTSSDPALFSNDETPDIENYIGNGKRRKKKTYEGTWWGDRLRKPRAVKDEPVTATTKRRQFERNFDSGIFMSDDSSNFDLSSESLLEQELLNVQNTEPLLRSNRNADICFKSVGEAGSRVHQSICFATAAALKRMPQGRPVNPKDHLIRKVVQDCLDSNNENVDWTGMDLDYLPPAVTDLKSMIKRINSETANDKLAPFETELKVYLGNNSFSHMPPPLLELTNIRFLSLRQNKLSEITPGIRTLINLEELNLSSNNLCYLPYEILQLLRDKKLNTIHSSPNPWMSIPDLDDRFAEAPSVVIWSNKQIAFRRVAVSIPEEYLPNGILLRHSTNSTSTNKQPHLSELVLRALLRHNTAKTDLSSYLSEDHPDSARRLLTTLHNVQSSGSRVCTFCTRDIVLPRYQWYEWWEIIHNVCNGRSNTESTLMPANDPELQIEVGLGLGDAILSTWDTALLENTDVLPLPFQRISCGCVNVQEGLSQELCELSASAVQVKAEDSTRHMA